MPWATSSGWPVLHSDVIRKELAGLDPLHHAPSSFGTGLYTPAMIDQTYDEMCARARQLLGMGQSVILDASFSTKRHRRIAMSVADSTSSDGYEVRCLLPTAEAARRLIARQVDHADASDADPEVAARMAQQFDPWPEAFVVGTLPPAEDVMPTIIEHVDNWVVHRLETAAMMLSLEARRAGYTDAMTPRTAMIRASAISVGMGTTDSVTP